MVKGISKQVIVVNATDKKLFDQAIFILSDEALADRGITEERLLQEARQYIRPGKQGKSRLLCPQSVVGAGAGAALMGLVWLLSGML